MNECAVQEMPGTFQKTPIFTAEELQMLDRSAIPRHVAIIPDGNRRWARKQASCVAEGHREGADTLTTIVRAAKELGIPTITFYLFSMENRSRNPEEINALMWLLETFLIDQRESMIEAGVRLHSIGDISGLPASPLKTLTESMEATSHCDKINMVMALNYGSRDEIKRAFHAMLSDIEKGKLSKGDITESLISSYLDTSPWPDPDLFIRSSGESRISNFLLWQLSYSEIYITDVLWPDFRPRDLFNALLYYQTRERRFGG